MKPNPPLITFLTLLGVFVWSSVFGQTPPPTINCQINRISPPNHSAEISCSVDGLPNGKAAISFVDRFAGIDRLSERVHSLKLTAASGEALPVEIRGNGLYLFSAKPGAVKFSYEMKLARALDPSQFALCSSIGTDAAVLMMADLLPRACSGEDCQANNSVRLKIVASTGWQLATTEHEREGVFDLSDNSRAVFFLARIREQITNIGQMKLRVAVAGEWNFSDEEIFPLAAAIAHQQAAMIRSREQGDFLVTVAPFPQPLTGLRSSAVTIGRTVVLMLNPNNDSGQTLKHFRRHLAHEMFHFYLPNAFRIRENFDWFWEGFTRYVALMTLAELRLIDLNEYLDTINSEYEAYLFNPVRLNLSLVAASPDKFSSAASYDLVYRKGMLVAALYDLELRWQSRLKSNLADVMKALYANYALTGREVGNQEVLKELSKLGDFARLIQNDVEGTREIDLAERVKSYGLKIEATQSRARLTAANKLSDRQREVLSSLLLPKKTVPRA
ncbi:MAG: hypothetical protein ACRD82_24080 [Blastocatellia bacterium]